VEADKIAVTPFYVCSCEKNKERPMTIRALTSLGQAEYDFLLPVLTGWYVSGGDLTHRKVCEDLSNLTTGAASISLYFYSHSSL
jgi:hypothetical protein